MLEDQGGNLQEALLPIQRNPSPHGLKRDQEEAQSKQEMTF